MEEIKVELDEGWRSAEDPNWLTTLGVGTCVSVGVGHDASRKAWLIHSSLFGQSTAELEGMFADIMSQRIKLEELNIWVCGADPTSHDADEDLIDETLLDDESLEEDDESDDDDDSEIDQDLTVVQEAVTEFLDNLLKEKGVIPNYMWEQSGDVELTWSDGRWEFKLD